MYDLSIRRINQACLAGVLRYGVNDEDGIGKDLNDLRWECLDTKTFAETISNTTSYKRVADALTQKRGDNKYYAFRALGGHGKNYSWEAPKRTGRTK